MSQPTSTAEYLADREGLDGTARVVFLRLLHDRFGFGRTAPRHVLRTIGIVAAVSAGAGVLLEIRAGSATAAVCLWLGMAVIGVLLPIVVARGTELRAPLHWEFEWRAYCLVVRPLILVRRPGLLDRNLALAGAGEPQPAPRHSDELRFMFRERRNDFWTATTIGWGAGSFAALVWRLAAGEALWLPALAVVGATLGAPAWRCVRLLVFHRMRRVAENL